LNKHSICCAFFQCKAFLKRPFFVIISLYFCDKLFLVRIIAFDSDRAGVPLEPDRRIFEKQTEDIAESDLLKEFPPLRPSGKPIPQKLTTIYNRPANRYIAAESIYCMNM